MDYPIFPDEIPIVINFLKNHPYITAFGPVTVAGDLKGFDSPGRWISVQGTGGNDENPVRVGAPRIDCNIYAEEKPVAKRLAQSVHAALKSMKNYTTSEAVVIRVESSTPSDLTDPVNSSPRFVVDATIYIRPN